MFWHLFLNRFKILLRTKSMIFWTLIFPIVLATFFNLAFANLYNDEKFEPVNIAIVDNEKYKQEENFVSLINDISEENGDQVFKITYVENEEAAKKKLENNDIAGYYTVENEVKVTVKKSGIDQTIMKHIVDNYYQTYSIIGNVYEFNPTSFKANLVESINDTGNYFKDKSNKNVDFTVIYFYTLIGMVCMYAAFFGMDATKATEANLSTKAARTSVAPTHKLKTLLISLLVGFIIQYVEVLILLRIFNFCIRNRFWKSNCLDFIINSSWKCGRH